MQDDVIFPLHPAQFDVYADQLLDTKSPHYNIGGYIKLKGELNKELFYETVSSGAKVFDSFRMKFDLNLPEPVIFLDQGRQGLKMSDLDFSEKEDGEKEALEWMQNRFNTPFEFDKDSPLYEQYLIKISNNEYWFFGKYHHLITDGYGFVVWVQYLAQKYKSLVNGMGFPFKFPGYIEEAIKASDYKASPSYEIDGQYWKDKIQAKPEKILLRKYFKDSSKKSATYIYELSENQRKLLDEIETSTRIRLHHLSIAALLIYFGKTSGESEFVFGIPVHKRLSKEARNIVGMFSGIMPYKGLFQEDIKLVDLLKQISETQKEDYKHQSYLIGDLARVLKVHTSAGYLFDLTINYKLLNFEISFGEDLNATIFELANEFQKNPLQLCWQDFGKQQPLLLQLDFSTEYFTREEIELLAKRIIYILEQFPNSMFKEIGSIDIIPFTEKSLIEKFNNKEEGVFQDKSIIDLFEAQVLKVPDKAALFFKNENLTYRELNVRSNQLAYYLTSRGVKPEELIPLCIERGFEMIIGMLGVLKAGGAYIPIDPEYPTDRIQYILNDANAHFLLVSKETKNKVDGFRNIETIELDDYVLFNNESTNNLENLSPNSLAYIIYTSGSTGKPKGVMIEHNSVVNLINSQTREFNVGSDESILQFSNYCFDASIEQIFLALFNGISLYLFPEGMQLNVEVFKNFLIENEISHIHATPSFLENLPVISSSFLKRVIAGGDVCKNELAKRWKGEVNFYNEYGPTETTVTAIEYCSNSDGNENNILLPIGKPLSNVSVYILDEKENNSPIGVLGEVYIGGVQVARGYLGKPELTQEKFIKDPFSNKQNSRLYRTGDLARWLPDGNIEYQGRMDGQVKIRGYRIELGEIESVLQQCKLVHQVAVLAKESGNDKRLVGYIVPAGTFDKQAIITYLRSKLPEYMVPAILIELKQLPVTSNGKVDKKSLPWPEDELTDNVYVAPATDVESKMVEAWKEILSLDQVGVTDNFFELGGHSLNAMQLSSRLHKLLNIKIDIGKVFSYPTIRELAGALSFENKDTYVEIKKLPKQEDYELSHAQKRFWILSHYKDSSKAYNFSGAYIIKGKLNDNALTEAIREVIVRHENLRTIFIEADGEPRQKIIAVDSIVFGISKVDLRDTSDANKTINENIENESAIPFVLEKGPLLRATLFQVSEEQSVLLFSIHHIVSDGWSKGILMSETLTLYKAFSSNLKPELPALRIQYKDYAAWHNLLIESQGNYWRSLYQDSIPLLDFPTDLERPKVLTFLGAMCHVSISEQLTADLKKLAIINNMSLNNLLFSLYGLLISQYSQQDQIVIGSLSSGRSHIELENLIGVFINFLPIKVSPSSSLNLSEYLQNSNQSLVHAYNNQDYPFDLMVEELIKQRDFSRNPFFDTMLNFHSENSLTFEASKKNKDAGITIESYDSIEKDLFQSVLDFKLDVELSENFLQLYLSYNSKLFTSERMEIFLKNFVSLLEKVIQEPDKKLKDYDSLTVEKEGLRNNSIEVIAEEDSHLQINICASFVAEPLQQYLDYWNTELELNIKVHFAPYNQVFQQLLDTDSLLNSGKGLNVLLIRLEDWLKDKKALSAKDQVNFLDLTFTDLTNAIQFTNNNTFAPFLVGIVPVNPSEAFEKEVLNHLDKLSKELAKIITKFSRMSLLNMEKIAVLYEVDELVDPGTDEIAHIPFTEEYYAAIGTYLARKISAFKGPGYKVIALDCDNTLWKGICGEVGATNVIIDENFSKLQEFVLEKYAEGFLLVLCSKNNEEDVWEVFQKHPHMKLKREHIAAHRINWELKSDNLLAISKELNLGMDSIIFVDDSEFEVEQLSLTCPDTLSLLLPQEPSSFSAFLDHTWAFDTFRVTEEDLQRNKRYFVEKQRSGEQVKHSSLTAFLESLLIKVNVRTLDESDIERAVQLTLRTNQFNLNGIRKTPQEIAQLIRSENSFSRIVEVSDRFGDYGIVGLVLAGQKQQELIVETFLLSCRVLGRNVEDFILSEIENYCLKNEIRDMSLLFKSTLKNKPFEEFLSRTDWRVDFSSNKYSRTIKISDRIDV
ncbi:MAG: amino acid adenylation domain-containing protein [Ginsengibacter sp.]